MITFSKTDGYAIRALSCLDAEGRQMVLAKEVARRTGIPRPYLVQVLHVLRKAGLIVAKRGYKGGVALSRPASEISLMEIVEAVGRSPAEPHCLFGFNRCPGRTDCPVRKICGTYLKGIENELRRITLAEVGLYVASESACT